MAGDYRPEWRWVINNKKGLSMKKMLFLCACAVLISCVQQDLKTQDVQSIDRLDILIFSGQNKPAVEAIQPYNYSSGALGAIASELAMSTQASAVRGDYEVVGRLFSEKRFNEVLADRVRDALPAIERVKVGNVSLNNSGDERLKDGLVKDRKGSLLVIDISHCFSPTQNFLQTYSKITLYTALKSPAYAMAVISQSEPFGDPYQNLSHITADKSEDMLGEEIARINSRFDLQVAERPADVVAINRQREREVSLARRNKRVVVKIRPPLAKLANDAVLLDTLLERSAARNANAVLAAIDDAFSVEQHQSIKFKTLGFPPGNQEGHINGYVIVKNPNAGQVVFRREESWLNTPTNMRSTTEILSYVEASGGFAYFGPCTPGLRF